MDQAGRRLARARLPEGVAGIARLHAMIGEQLGEDADEAEVLVGTETDRGPWVAALLAAGYSVYAVNPLQAARYRERHGVSGAKSDPADAHILADIVRTDAHQLRSIGADSSKAQAIKVVARVHKTLIWERTRHAPREATRAERAPRRLVGREVPLHQTEDVLPERHLRRALPEAADADDRAARLLDHLDQEPEGLARGDQVLDDEDLAALAARSA